MVPVLPLRHAFIDSWTPYGHGAYPRKDQPSRRMAVSHYHLMAFRILEVFIAVKMLLDFCLKSGLQQLLFPFTGNPFDSSMDLVGC